ncbi:MAG: hypothetical protein ACLGGV_04830 [Bacteroidia bacterium]
MKSELQNKLKNYTALTASLTAIGNSSFATVQINTINFIGGIGDSYSLDINNDGVEDYDFWTWARYDINEPYNSQICDRYYFAIDGSLPYFYNYAAVSSSSNLVIAFNNGDKIGSSLTFDPARGGLPGIPRKKWTKRVKHLSDLF